MKATLSIPLTCRELAHILAIPTPREDGVIRAVVTDSREAEKGDLFFAFDGQTHRGEEHIPEARKRGAYAIGTAATADAFTVRDTRAALMALAKAYKERLAHLRQTVAITGSVGKTTTKELLRTLADTTYRVHATAGNFNNEIGLPMTVLSAPRDTELLILELGINHPSEMRPLAAVARPGLAIVTNIGHAHIGNFGSEQALLEEKLRIREELREDGRLLLPWEDTRLPRTGDGVCPVSVTERDAPFALLTERISEDRREVTLYEKGDEVAHLPLPFADEGSYKNAALAIAAARLLGVSPSVIAERLRHGAGGCRRMRRCTLFGGGCLLDDAYNASPESMTEALTVLSRETDATRCVLLGDMLELGAYTEGMHREIGRSLVRYGVERAFFYGVYAPFYRLGAIEGGMDPSRIWINNDPTSPERTVEQIRCACTGKETLLCKGSHGVNLTKIIEKIRCERT